MKASIRLKLAQDQMRARLIKGPASIIMPCAKPRARRTGPGYHIHQFPCPLHVSTKTKDGRCVECMREYRRQSYDLNGASLHDRYCALRSGANRRGITFDLTQGDFEEIVSAPCFYAIQWEEGIKSGVDRKDSKLGYTKDNCVPCCAKHNLFKSYILSTDQTKDASRRYKVRCENTLGGRKKGPRT